MSLSVAHAAFLTPPGANTEMLGVSLCRGELGYLLLLSQLDWVQMSLMLL